MGCYLLVTIKLMGICFLLLFFSMTIDEECMVHIPLGSKFKLQTVVSTTYLSLLYHYKVKNTVSQPSNVENHVNVNYRDRQIGRYL